MDAMGKDDTLKNIWRSEESKVQFWGLQDLKTTGFSGFNTKTMTQCS